MFLLSFALAAPPAGPTRDIPITAGPTSAARAPAESEKRSEFGSGADLPVAGGTSRARTGVGAPAGEAFGTAAQAGTTSDPPPADAPAPPTAPAPTTDPAPPLFDLNDPDFEGADLTSDPAAPRPAPAADADEDEHDEETRELTAEERHRRASNLYMQALDAWQNQRWSRAWYLASQSLILDPDLTPARLLTGYALLRMKRRDEARVTLEGLSLEPGPSPLPEKRHEEAQKLLKKHLAPYRRDQWSISIGNITYVERMGDTASPLNGYVFTGRAPIIDRLAVRIEGGAPWGGTGGDLDIRGPRFGLAAVTSQPLGKGKAQIDLGLGPAFWLAEGRYWSDGSEPYFGARGFAALDVRLGPTLGLRWEAGASVFPTASDALSFYAEPLDFRFAIDAWFGK